MVRKRGFEPPRPCGHKLLRLARLPVPPLPHEGENASELNSQVYRESKNAILEFDGSAPMSNGQSRLARLAEETVVWLKTLASASVYATLIVTFLFQVARVDGQS